MERFFSVCTICFPLLRWCRNLGRIAALTKNTYTYKIGFIKEKVEEYTNMQKIGYLGPSGTFTEEAALTVKESYPGEIFGFRDIPELILAVQNGDIDSAVVPIENVIEGTVNLTVDMLAHEVDLQIIAERTIPIHQCLVAKPGVNKEDIIEIISHPQALAQCRRFLTANFPDVPTASISSTAAGAKKVRDSHLPLAAIANKRAAQLFGLRILAENIEDYINNCTRFVLLSRCSALPTGEDKTSIVFSVSDEPGSLLRALEIFAQRNINLTRIESRPMRTRMGQYLFFVDFEGHCQDKKVSDALASVRAISTFYKHLGSYPVIKDEKQV
jgi:prephenate dehydratase